MVRVVPAAQSANRILPYVYMAAGLSIGSRQFDRQRGPPAGSQWRAVSDGEHMQLSGRENEQSRDVGGALRIHLLGLLDFESATQLQAQLVAEATTRDDSSGTLLLCEHPPLITIGRSGSREDIPLDQSELGQLGLEVRWVGRGGGTVLHAPGQLAVYPIIPLKRRGLGLAEYSQCLLGAVTDLAAELRVPVEPTESHSDGVYGRCGRIAAAGIAVQQWISSYGLFLDVCTNAEWLRMVHRPDGRKAASLQQHRCRHVTMSAVREGVIRCLSARLGYEQQILITGHPQLKRTTRTVHVPA